MSQATATRTETLYREHFPESEKLARLAAERFPSGVTHDGRYLLPFPVFVDKAFASRKTTVDGHELIDYWMGHGSLILGHSHPAIVEAVQRQMDRGTHFGACHELELEWARLVCELVLSAERVRFTSSGTEATLMALRIARIASGRQKVIKFAGHFHGWHDQLIPAADPPHEGGDYAMPGITDSVMGDLVVVPPNDLAAVERAIDEHNPACVIVEATGGRWGVVPMRGEFLRGLRELTTRKNVLLIMDEVISGFRVHPGGVQGVYDIVPDLTTLAKILAGGLPGGCVAGRADLMDYIAFGNASGKKMKHPGTYNANPLSAAAGTTTLSFLSDGEPCNRANEVAAQLRQGLNSLFAEKDVNWVAYGDFALLKILPNYSGPRPADDDFVPYDNDFSKLDRPIDQKLSHAFRCALLLNGIDMMGWGALTSAAHTDQDVAETIDAFGRAVDGLRADAFVE